MWRFTENFFMQFFPWIFRQKKPINVFLNVLDMNGSSHLTDILSLRLLDAQRPIYILWIVCSCVNILASSGAILGFTAWKLCSEALRLYLVSFFTCDLINSILVSILAVFHLTNYFAGKPETMNVRDCLRLEHISKN